MLSVFKANIRLILFAAVVFFAAAMPAVGEEGTAVRGVVEAFHLNIRSAASQESDVVSVLKKGDTVDVLEKEAGIGGWLKIQSGKDIGYIRNRPQYIRLIDLLPEKKVEKQQIQARIKSQEKMVETFSQKEVEIIEGLNEIDFALNKARQKLSALSAEIVTLEDRIARMDQDKKALAEEIVKNREYAGQRLRALYKMNMIGRLDAAGLPDSIFDFFLQQNAMKRILHADFQVLEKQHRDLAAFETLEADLNREIQARTALEIQVKDQMRIDQTETRKKEMILQQIRKQKKLSLAAVEALRDAEIALDRRMSHIQERGSSDLKGTSFSDYKGRLMIPVKGEVISEYGPAMTGDYKSYTFQKGIDIRVERGEPVKSVFKGKIMFAQWLKGYGNLVIVDHGDHYYTLYAHVEEIFKQEGERVETGEVIATAGDTGSIKGLCLHFELRHHGKPVNPMTWLRKGA